MTNKAIRIILKLDINTTIIAKKTVRLSLYFDALLRKDFFLKIVTIRNNAATNVLASKYLKILF